ncbi:uncharacterized protein A4U43_C08F10400 [Asparagus officinalis]|nr:uncharacterized protein A4U43_C08F10400 [Asparagus officinalis]
MWPQLAGTGLLVTQLNYLENIGLVDESSPSRDTTTLAIEEDAVSPSSMPQSSLCPGKELVEVADVKGRARTLPDHEENGPDERILGEMTSANIHLARQACLARETFDDLKNIWVRRYASGQF